MSEDAGLLEAIARTGGDPADLPFWQGCREGRFLLHRCGLCGASYWPASRCVEHGDKAMRWEEGSGRGSVYTYTVMHHAYTPDMQGRTPYVVAVVKLEEGPFYHANIIDCPVEAVAVGMAVEAVMTEHAGGLTLPMFRPVISV